MSVDRQNIFPESSYGVLGQMHQGMVKNLPVIPIQADRDPRQIAYNGADIIVIKIFHGYFLQSQNNYNENKTKMQDLSLIKVI